MPGWRRPRHDWNTSPPPRPGRAAGRPGRNAAGHRDATVAAVRAASRPGGERVDDSGYGVGPHVQQPGQLAGPGTGMLGHHRQQFQLSHGHGNRKLAIGRSARLVASTIIGQGTRIGHSARACCAWPRRPGRWTGGRTGSQRDRRRAGPPACRPVSVHDPGACPAGRFQHPPVPAGRRASRPGCQSGRRPPGAAAPGSCLKRVNLPRDREDVLIWVSAATHYRASASEQNDGLGCPFVMRPVRGVIGHRASVIAASLPGGKSGGHQGCGQVRGPVGRDQRRQPSAAGQVDRGERGRHGQHGGHAGEGVAAPGKNRHHRVLGRPRQRHQRRRAARPVPALEPRKGVAEVSS